MTIYLVTGRFASLAIPTFEECCMIAAIDGCFKLGANCIDFDGVRKISVWVGENLVTIYLDESVASFNDIICERRRRKA